MQILVLGSNCPASDHLSLMRHNRSRYIAVACLPIMLHNAMQCNLMQPLMQIMMMGIDSQHDEATSAG